MTSPYTFRGRGRAAICARLVFWNRVANYYYTQDQAAGTVANKSISEVAFLPSNLAWFLVGLLCKQARSSQLQQVLLFCKQLFPMEYAT